MSNQIPLKVRLVVASFHTLNALFPLISIFSILIIWIVWLFTKATHSFIDLSGRNALNCAINNLLWMTVVLTLCLLVFSLTCGIGNQDPSLFMVSLMLACLLELAYIIYAVVAGIFALRGHNFTSRLIYPFIQAE
jgi:uncharacterized Tic20 family protein